MQLDKSLLRNVQREFQTLEKSKRSPTAYDILDIAGALRHLLIDDGPGLFKRAWDELKPHVEGEMPRQPFINAFVLDTLFDLPHIQEGTSIVITADATMENGVRIPYHSFYPGNLSEEALKQQSDLMDKMRMKLDVYKRTTCMILGQYIVKRETAIKYVANKLGGRHYDKKRKLKPNVVDENHIFRVLDEAFDFFGDNPQPNNLQFYYGANGNALQAVILGLCADLEDSPDVMWFLDTLNHFLDKSPPLGFK